MSNQLTIAQIQHRISQSLFHRMFKPEVLEVDNEQLKLVVKVSMCDEFERQPGTGQWHGGILASLVDITGCYALMLIASGPMLTLNFSTDFLRLAASNNLIASAKVKRAGRTVGFVDVEIHDNAGELVATGRACYAIKSPLSDSQPEK